MIDIRDSAEFRELDLAAAYRIQYNELRAASVRSSVVGVFLGLLSVGLGLSTTGIPPLAAALGILGASLLATSAWMLSALTPTAALLNGFAWVFVGCCQLAAAALHAGEETADSVTGIIMLIGSWFSFRLYSPLSQLLLWRPPAEMLERADGVVRDVRHTTMESDPRIIEFGNGIHWKAWIGEMGGIFVGQRGWDVLFLERRGVTIDREEEVTDGRPRVATFQLGEYSFSGKISQEASRRYEKWKRETPHETVAGQGT